MKRRFYDFLLWLSYRGLERVGDIFVPASGAFPAFSATGCAVGVTEIYRTTPSSDVTSLQTVFIFFNLVPKWIMLRFFRFLGWVSLKPWHIAIHFRKLYLGVRGIVLSLYYSNLTDPAYAGPRPWDAIHFQLQCVEKS